MHSWFSRNNLQEPTSINKKKQNKQNPNTERNLILFILNSVVPSHQETQKIMSRTQ
jgi:hypothetical protein